MKISETLKTFLSDHKDLLAENNFYKLFEAAMLKDNIGSGNKLDLINLLESIDIDSDQIFRDSDLLWSTVYSYTDVTEVKIPSYIKRIGASAFCMTDLKSIDIPEGVESIGADAFMSCYFLEEVKLPSTLSSVAHNAFEHCLHIKKVYIPRENELQNINDIFSEDMTGSTSVEIIYLD